MTSDSGLPAAHEEALLAGLRAAAERRARFRAVDQQATAEAAAMWQGLRRLALPLYLARDAARNAPRGRAVPLYAMPTLEESGPLRWRPERPVGGVERMAREFDVPSRIVWPVDLATPAAACGWLALAPEAWGVFQEPLELVVRLRGANRTTIVEHVVRLHPLARALDRRWVPWRVELPASGSGTLELETRSPDGPIDRAWLLVGDPVLDLGGRRPSRPGRRPRRRPGRAAAPAIAILMPVHDPPLALLEQTLASVAAQTSARWELCVVDDGSRDPAVIERLRTLAASDARVRLTRHEQARGISAATNAALALATAPYVATLDHDDLLDPEAIERVGQCLAASPAVDVLYSDNDLVAADGTHFSAALKPDWSPDLLRACMYTLHLGVYRRALVEEIGGWRTAFDGAQDHDLVLRLTERTDRIIHLPEVLAHWRAHAGSAALGELAKPAAYDRGRAAVEEHVARTGIDGTVKRLPWAGRYRVVHDRKRSVRVILPPAAEAADVERWQRAVRTGDTVQVATSADPAGWRAAAAGASTVLIAEDLAAPLDAAAIDELVGHVEAGAAAAAGLVVDVDDRVVAGGVAFPDGLPLGLHLGADASAADQHPSLTMASNRLAVRGVVALPATALDEAIPVGAGALWVVALTRALAEAGGRVVWAPHARFRATPEATLRWWSPKPAELLALDVGSARDPFWNPRRRSDRNDESYRELDASEVTA